MTLSKNSLQSAALSDGRLADVLEAIASQAVSPGAGAAAAMTLALAAACGGKAISISRKHRAIDTDLIRLQSELDWIRSAALQGAQEDAARFEELLRHKSMDNARRLVRTGEYLQALAERLMIALGARESLVEPQVVGDVHAARELCAAFRVVQAENLQENRGLARDLGGS